MDTLTKAERSERMARVPSKNTTPELIVRRLVFSLGYRYRLHGRLLPGKPDLVFAGRRKVIFVNGCFWHRHKGCHKTTTPKANRAFWNKKFAATMVRDRRNRRRLVRDDWKVLTIWECEIRHLERLERRIISFLEG